MITRVLQSIGALTVSFALLPSSRVQAQSAVGSQGAQQYTIYNTLGPKNDRFSKQYGIYVKGPKASNGQQWVAQPFLVTHDSIVTEIEVAIVNISGTNAVTLSLNQDADGLPGKALHTWNLKDLPSYPECCELDVAKDAPGLKVSKGSQYWVVASTNKGTEDTDDLWCFNYLTSSSNPPSAPNAFLIGQGGWETQWNSQVQALAVFGKKIE
jgi:hypothetical protein